MTNDGRFVRWNVQVNRLQLLCVEVEGAVHARVQRPLATSVVRR